ncbi:hypothetical protein [Bradyrhizobium sp. McL0615]|uniref:hypothetical protein n=1 Tax=Bradyrhizobium sp. McL0615 TaxID=3415673 RepID=UPI003CF2987F
MSDTETSPAAMLQAFDSVLEARLNKEDAKLASSLVVDPRLKSIFTTAVATALDIVDFSADEVCAQFASLAAEGVSLARPPHVKINGKFEPLLPTSDRNIPLRPPTVAEDDTPLGAHW